MRALLSCHHLRSGVFKKGLVVRYMMDPVDEHALRGNRAENRVRTFGRVVKKVLNDLCFAAMLRFTIVAACWYTVQQLKSLR